ncbi:zinc dependent phospholipase C family protein [Pectobacterium brasiliense]|uniref:zinc dependent phospholipase C family protein n=1 Tax=Pectobacterium brasiliense TaxID=180957 RepID=UPI00069C2A92|nr:zinc dependent phospholipase C family protein [Pectobacterium brasiliense]MBN3191427.1 zinc dependent phospholipase C family protein [Pectobacterium brasiliense]MCG5050707.1 zinc dependent phospholipase C family protein [Pectobacterium brasiliense]
MAGAYAHLAVVNVASEMGRLEEARVPKSGILAVKKYLGFCELGSVSPDYPYLAIADSGAAEWADKMHYEKTGDVVQSLAKGVMALQGAEKEKALAWLLGYVAHVVTDMTIHPVVEDIVGPYAQNKREHRICEMNQDAHIFPRLGLGEVGLSEHLKSGMQRCSQDGQLDETIKRLWESALQQTYTQAFSGNKPDINKWNSRFLFMVGEIAEEGNRLIPLARHVAVNLGLTYPAVAELDQQFLTNIATPGGRKNYDDVFDLAVIHVVEAWRLVAESVEKSDVDALSFFGHWNLDTGRDVNTDKLVYWKEVA